MTARRFNNSASRMAAARNAERRPSPLNELLLNPSSDSLADKSGLVLTRSAVMLRLIWDS